MSSHTHIHTWKLFIENFPWSTSVTQWNGNCTSIIIYFSTRYIVNCNFSLIFACLLRLIKWTTVLQWRQLKAVHWLGFYTWKVIHQKILSMRWKKFMLTIHLHTWSLATSITSSNVVGHRLKLFLFLDDHIPPLIKSCSIDKMEAANFG